MPSVQTPSRDFIGPPFHDGSGKCSIDAALADFDGVWNALSPREQAQLAALLVARVEFDATGSTVAVWLHPTGIKAWNRKRLGGAA